MSLFLLTPCSSQVLLVSHHNLKSLNLNDKFKFPVTRILRRCHFISSFTFRFIAVSANSSRLYHILEQSLANFLKYLAEENYTLKSLYRDPLETKFCLASIKLNEFHFLIPYSIIRITRTDGEVVQFYFLVCLVGKLKQQRNFDLGAEWFELNWNIKTSTWTHWPTSEISSFFLQRSAAFVNIQALLFY